ncbi:MAG: hypothetical protein HOP17_00665 [Acidobacteria bacterium]|nr:hypothetical protein [Acidobacteriota bacterium]
MKRFSNALWSFAVFGLILFGITATADAQRRTEREVRDAVRTLNSQVDDLQYAIDFEIKNNGGADSFEDAEAGLRNLKDKLSTFEKNVTAKRENRDDVNEIITAAKEVDRAVSLSNANRSVQGDWADIKRSIESLSAKYGVTANWNSRVSNNSRTTAIQPPVRSTTSVSGGLSGTYRLDTGRSESVADILSGTSVAGSQKQDLESKLEAPEEIAIQLRGNQVTLASSKAAPVTIVADGREKTENTGGKTVRLKASLRGDVLTVSSLGGETDYTITFSSADRGQTLKVTRRITTDYLSETIFAESVYTKTDAVARLGIDNGGSPVDDDTYSSNDPGDSNSTYGNTPSVVTPRIGEFIVPNGTQVSGVLENPIDTKVSQNNDRFRLTVQSPDEFRGAIIEGYISGVGRSGQVSGRSNVTFNFTKITLRDGKAYDFAGTLQGIKDTQGKDVKIDAEGTAKGDSQTKETVKRGGIGAGAGAIIGAIIGGGKGAAIGAVIGGGAGAGSVVVQGRDDVKLQQGSVITVTSSSPIRRDQQISEN